MQQLICTRSFLPYTSIYTEKRQNVRIVALQWITPDSERQSASDRQNFHPV